MEWEEENGGGRDETGGEAGAEYGKKLTRHCDTKCYQDTSHHWESYDPIWATVAQLEHATPGYSKHMMLSNEKELGFEFETYTH